MRKTIARAARGLAVIAAVSVIGFGASRASARRAHAIGNPAFAVTSSCFNFDYSSGTAGVALNNTAACRGFLIPPIWVIPTQLDSTGAKTVSLTVKQSAANQLSCLLLEYNPSGTILQAIPYDAFAVGGYVTASKAITIATGNSLDVLCSFKQSDANISNARILSVEY